MKQCHFRVVSPSIDEIPENIPDQFITENEMKSNEVDKKICNYCKSSFDNKQALKTHITRNHSKVKPKRNFASQNCRATFECKNELETDIRDVACKLCDKTFTSKKQLETHMERDHLISRLR